MNDFNPRKRPTPQEVSAYVARTFFNVTDEASRRRAIRKSLIAIVWFTVFVPVAFYLRFGRVGPLGWGTTVFFDVLWLLSAIGLFFQPRTEYHSPVWLHDDWLDRVGAFWLVACAFGPLFGWIVTTGTFPITLHSWRWLYGLRVLLAAGLPLLTALPLTRYVRGKSAWVALPLLLGVTLLPVSTAMMVSQDLWEGPITRENKDGATELFLKHTQRSLGVDH